MSSRRRQVFPQFFNPTVRVLVSVLTKAAPATLGHEIVSDIFTVDHITHVWGLLVAHPAGASAVIPLTRHTSRLEMTQFSLLVLEEEQERVLLCSSSCLA